MTTNENPMTIICDHEGCEAEATECHAGEEYLCDKHYKELAEAMRAS